MPLVGSSGNTRSLREADAPRRQQGPVGQSNSRRTPSSDSSPPGPWSRMVSTASSLHHVQCETCPKQHEVPAKQGLQSFDIEVETSLYKATPAAIKALPHLPTFCPPERTVLITDLQARDVIVLTDQVCNVRACRVECQRSCCVPDQRTAWTTGAEVRPRTSGQQRLRTGRQRGADGRTTIGCGIRPAEIKVLAGAGRGCP